MAKMLAVAGLLAAAGWGQQPAAKRPMTFADLMAMKRVSDPQVSPSGKWVLFLVTDVSLEQNTKVNHLWVVPLGSDGADPKADSSAALRNDKQGSEAAERVSQAQPMSQRRDMGRPAVEQDRERLVRQVDEEQIDRGLTRICTD